MELNRIMKNCLCQGNKSMREMEHMRSIAEKAAVMDECVYILYKVGDVYKFCREGENWSGEFIEFIFP